MKNYPEYDEPIRARETQYSLLWYKCMYVYIDVLGGQTFCKSLLLHNLRTNLFINSPCSLLLIPCADYRFVAGSMNDVTCLVIGSKVNKEVQCGVLSQQELESSVVLQLDGMNV